MRKLRGEKKHDAVINGGMRYCNVIAATIGSAVVGGVVSNSASKRASAASDRASAASNAQSQIGQEQWDRYQKIYAPLEDGMVTEAQNFDTTAAYDRAAADANATVNTQYGLAADRLRRTPGLDPSSAGSTAANSGLALAQAGSGAAAQNAARTGIRDKAWARKTDALSLGKGLAATASSTLGASASSAGNIAATQQNNANNTAAGVGGMFRDLANSSTVQNWFTPSTPDLAISTNGVPMTSSGATSLGSYGLSGGR